MNKFNVINVPCTIDAVSKSLVEAATAVAKEQFRKQTFQLKSDGKNAVLVTSTHPEFGDSVFATTLWAFLEDFHQRGWKDREMLYLIRELQQGLANLKHHYRKHKDPKSPKV